MKKLNRLVAGLLTVAMAVSMIPTAAFAQSDYDDEIDDAGFYSEDADFLYDDADDEVSVDTLSLDDNTEGDIMALAEGETASGYCGGEGDGTNLTWTLEDGVLTISGEGKMANYSETDSEAFSIPWANYSISEIIVEESVTSIGSYAFSNCTETLTDVTLPESLLSIGNDAFWCCNGLVSMDFPSGITEIGDEAFYGCLSLDNIELPDSLDSIGKRAFIYCPLKKVEIPNNVTYIGNSAFARCTNLESIVLSENITSINSQTFEYCTALSEITFLESCPTFGTYCFKEVSATAYYPSTWTSAPSSTVGGATNITWVSYEPGTTPGKTDPDTCQHTNWAYENIKDATETEDGYTGDTVCLDCGEIIHYGEVILANNKIKLSDSAYVELSVEKTGEGENDDWLYQVKAIFVSTSDEESIANLDVSLDLDEELTAEENLYRKLDVLGPASSKTIAWTIHVPKKQRDKNYTIALGISNDEIDREANRNFTVSGIGTNDYIFRYGEDHYSFGNSSDDFENTYYVSDKDMDTFLKSLTPVEWVKVAFSYAKDPFTWFGESDNLVEWDGSCFGISSTMALFRAGYLDTVDWETTNGDIAQDIYSIKPIAKGVDDELESMINVYQMSQVIWASPTYQSQNAHDEDSFAKTAKEMWDKANNIGEYGAGQEPFLVCLKGRRIYQSGASKTSVHAVVCYGAESGTYMGEDGQIYSKRLRIADPNQTSDKNTFEQRYIYISDDYKSAYYRVSWCDNGIEYAYDYYDSLGYVHTELSEMDLYNYNSRTTKARSSMNSIYTDGMKNFTVLSDDKTAAVENNEVTGGNLKVGPYYVAKALAADELNDTSGEEEVPFWVMEDNHSSYTITPNEDEKLDATIFFDDIALTVTGDASSAVYNDDGTVTVKDAVGNIAIRAAINDGNLTFANVEGDANGDVTVKFNADSLSVSGAIDNVVATNYTTDGNESEIELDENGTAYADVNGTLTTDKGNVTPSEPTDPSTPSSGGGGGAGIGIAVAGAAAVVGTAVALKASQQATATATLPDSTSLHVIEGATEKAFEVGIKDKTVVISSKADTAVLTGARSYLEQLSAQGYGQITFKLETSAKQLLVVPVTKEVTVNVSELLNATPAGGTFSVTLQ